MRPKYTDVIHNAFSEARAWKLTTMAVTALCALLGISLILQSQNTPVVLVPAGFANGQGKVVVEPGAQPGTSPDYLAQVAVADVGLILTWEPSDVLLQYERFLNRTTSALYARENVRLIAQGNDEQKNAVSQSFYPEDVQVDVQDKKVHVRGYLIRWTGDKEVLRTEEQFTVTYVNQEGYLHVADLELTQ